MVTSLNVNSAGTTFFSGTASGLDTASLIQNAVNAKLLPKARLDDKVAKNLNKITAYQDLKTHINSLKAAFSKLKTDAVLGNVFDGRSATLSSSSSTAASSILSATVTKDAAKGNYNVVVGQLAKAFVAQGADQGSYSSAIGNIGSFTIQQDGDTAVTISYDPSASMQTIRDAINAQTSTSGVTADIIQASPGQYRLVIKGTDTAKNVTIGSISGENILETLGVTDAGGSFTDVTQSAQQASITVDGIVITSNTNVFSNVFSGVSFNALSAAPGTTVNITIDNDTKSAYDAIKAAVDAYNTLRKKVADYRKVNDAGVVDANAHLYGETVNNLLGTDLRRLVTGSYGYGSFNGLSSAGISLNANSDLEINATTLNAALKDHYDEVAGLFATGNSHISGSKIFSTTGAVDADGSFTITKETGNSVTVNFNSTTTLSEIRDAINAETVNTGMQAEIVALSSGGYRLVLKGASGENYAINGDAGSDALGISTGANSFTNLNKGIADTFDTLLDGYTNTTGYITKAIEGFQSTNTSLSKRADEIKTRTDAYQLLLVNRYAKLEAKIQAAQNAKSQILAILNSKNNNS